MELRFIDEVQCYVQSLEYDFHTRTGKILLEDGSCTDMSGCIRLFKKIDPEVKSIETIAGGKKDTSYHLDGQNWSSHVATQPRPKS